jgi:hypothetical protein
MCRGRRECILLHLHIQREKIVLGEPSWSVFWLQKPYILPVCVCVREEDTGGREDGAHATTPTYTTGKDSPEREPSWSVFWLQKPSILRVCVRKEDTGGRETVPYATAPMMMMSFICSCRNKNRSRSPCTP